MKHIVNQLRTRRILALCLALLMVMTALAGCTKKNKTPEPTEPSSPPGLSAPTSSTVPPTDPTEAPTEAPFDKAELLNIRSAPDMDASIIGHLEPDADVDILRREEMNGVDWALIREGWICIEYLEQYYDFGQNAPTEPESANPTAPTTGTEGTTPNNTTTPNNNTTPNTNNNNTNTDKDPAVVTATELNIRESADKTSDRVGSYKLGDRIIILQRKDGWARTEKGWVSLDYLYEEGEKGKNGCKGVVITNGLNVRQGPATTYDSVGSVSFGDRLNILERITLGDYVWGFCEGKGWIRLDKTFVYIDGDKGEGAGHGTVIGEGVNVRSGPGTKFDAVTTVGKGTEIDILFVLEIGDTAWGYFNKGWISMDYVGMG